MRFLWIFYLLPLGLSYGSRNPCDSDHATNCYADLVHYESLAFPLYGHDFISLDETCMIINASFECLHSYSEMCYKSPQCNDECKELIEDAHEFFGSTGLKDLAIEMCNEYSVVRTIYLENYHCLEENSEAYAACHNDSQLSQEYISTISGVEVIHSRCCFFTWYHDCFMNATRDHCGENATFFVSFAMHKLVGHIADHLCMSTNISCDRPPLPPDSRPIDLDKDKPDVIDNDVDNSINDISGNSAALNLRSVGLMVVSYCCIVLSKLFL